MTALLSVVLCRDWCAVQQLRCTGSSWTCGGCIGLRFMLVYDIVCIIMYACLYEYVYVLLCMRICMDVYIYA